MSIKLYGSIIVTYRCNAHCNMCDVWKSSAKPNDEIGLEVIRKLPNMYFTNVTGGEPFVRQDLPDIITELRKKTRRIVISTNGFFTERIVDLCKRYPDLGIRISIEGLRENNDRIRGIPNGYDRIQDTLKRLQDMGLKDIGFAMTVQDENYQDVVNLFKMARGLDYEFATAVVHNSYYFHKLDNKITKQEKMIAYFEELVNELMKGWKAKNWFRAYFNYGLINYIKGNSRLLPCGAGKNSFFLDPFGEIRPCNGLDEATPENSMGNLSENDFEEIWHGQRAKKIRESLRKCPKNCWMIGTASPAIKEHMFKVSMWVIKNKITSIMGKKVCV